MSLVKNESGISTNEARSLKDRLREKLNPGTHDETTLLLDVSGSMAGQPIMKLRELAAKFTNSRRFEFSDSVRELSRTEVVGAVQGGTDMANAFDHMKSVGIKHIILLTDGAPNSEMDALDSAKGLKIDIIYIGPPPAPDFLQKLAGRTGGKYGDVSIDELLKLERTVRALLPDPKKSINL